MGGRALDHGDISACLPQGGANIMGGIVGADDHAFLARIGIGAGMLAGMMLVALEFFHAGEFRHVGNRRHARGQHQLLGLERDGLAVAHHLHRPFLLGRVIGGALAKRRAPVIQLHDLRVHFQPVADLVLGRENRPVIGERQIGHVVIPDRIMQAERLVALAPAVAGPFVLFHDDGGHPKPLHARAQAQCRPGRRPQSGNRAVR